MKLILNIIILTLGFAQIAFADMDKARAALEANDYKTALKEFKRDAKKNPEAHFQIALMYDSNEEFGIDKKKAFKSYLNAAKKDHVEAQYIVYQRYKDGVGTKENVMKGVDFLIKAAEQHHEQAQIETADFYFVAHVFTDKAETGAFKWNNVLSDRGYLPASKKLAFLYHQPAHLEKDLEKSYMHHIILTLSGEEPISDKIALLEQQLSPEQINSAKESANAWIAKHQPTP